MKLRTSPFVDRGTVFVVADTEHPEAAFEGGDAEASIVYCHRDDERKARDAFALVGEEMDVSAACAALRGVGLRASVDFR